MGSQETNLAWRLFNFNWLPVALLGGLLLVAITYSDFSLERLAFGVTTGVGIVLALISYGCVFAKLEIQS
jgi:hypothetical protein